MKRLGFHRAVVWTAVLLFSGAPVFAEDAGRVGTLIRSGDRPILTPGAQAQLPPPVREPTLRDAFRSNEDTG